MRCQQTVEITHSIPPQVGITKWQLKSSSIFKLMGGICCQEVQWSEYDQWTIEVVPLKRWSDVHFRVVDTIKLVSVIKYLTMNFFYFINIKLSESELETIPGSKMKSAKRMLLITFNFLRCQASDQSIIYISKNPVIQMVIDLWDRVTSFFGK